MDQENHLRMNIRDSYDSWAESYDSMINKTRDLEGEVLRNTMMNPHYGNIVELGSGTGKNTDWLAKKADNVIALDFSRSMIARAEKRLTGKNIQLFEADITKPWPIKDGWANLIACSLVLEHVEDLDFIFKQASKVLKRRGKFYICELHPWKQYSGSRAKFQTEEGLQQPDAFVHHFSDYLTAAKKHNFVFLALDEHFDDREKENVPRLLSLVFENET